MYSSKLLESGIRYTQMVNLRNNFLGQCNKKKSMNLIKKPNIQQLKNCA